MIIIIIQILNKIKIQILKNYLNQKKELNYLKKNQKLIHY